MNGPDVIVIEDAELNSLALEHELDSALEEEEIVEAHPCVKPDFQSNKSKNIKTSTPQNPCERDAEELLDEACENCVICMSALVGPPYSDPLAVSIECGHLFHRGCISKWLETKNSCPSCKRRCRVDSLVTPRWSPLAVLQEISISENKSSDTASSSNGKASNREETQRFIEYLLSMRNEFEGPMRKDVETQLDECTQKLHRQRRKRDRQKLKFYDMERERQQLQHSMMQLKQSTSALWSKVKRLASVKDAWRAAEKKGVDPNQFLASVVPELENRHNEEELMKRLKWMAKEHQLQSSRTANIEKDLKALESNHQVALETIRIQKEEIRRKLGRNTISKERFEQELAEFEEKLDRLERKCDGCGCQLEKGGECSFCPADSVVPSQVTDTQKERDSDSSSSSDEVSFEEKPQNVLTELSYPLAVLPPKANGMRDRIRKQFDTFDKMDQRRRKLSESQENKSVGIFPSTSNPFNIGKSRFGTGSFGSSKKRASVKRNRSLNSNSFSSRINPATVSSSRAMSIYPDSSSHSFAMGGSSSFKSSRDRKAGRRIIGSSPVTSSSMKPTKISSFFSKI